MNKNLELYRDELEMQGTNFSYLIQRVRVVRMEMLILKHIAGTLTIIIR